jgi:hypothetical protein
MIGYTSYIIKLLLVPFIILFSGYNIIAQNILISNKNNPNEPSIIMDPKNPAVLIAGANLNNYYISKDTGHTWTEHNLNSSFGVWGDPALAVDTASNFYFFHLSNPPSGNWIDRIVCQKSSDNGSSWTDGSYAGLNGTKAQDKEWWTVDRKNNNMYITWTQFDDYGSFDPNDSSVILFSKSVDAGNSWSAPVRINKIAGDCIDRDNTVEGAVPAIGPNGEIYVAWAGPDGLVFNKSLDHGDTWLNHEIKVTSIPGGWDYDISGIYRANGLPVTTCDVSNGPHRGTIYINWSDQRNGVSNTDIWLVKSTDGGNTWTAPIKVNDDNSKRQQFFTWMTIDQTSGNLYFVFYDRRNHADDSTDVYIAASTDGGNTFINRKISQSPFLPNSGVFFGDYTNITAHDGIVRAIWTRLNNGQLSIWTDVTPLKDILTSTKEVNTSNVELDFENYPNPSHDYAYVSFKLHATAIVNLAIYDLKGSPILTIIKNESRNYGKYVERIDLDELHLPAGTYLLKLDVDGESKVIRQIRI